jgi:hypothetical protein
MNLEVDMQLHLHCAEDKGKAIDIKENSNGTQVRL